MASLPPPPLRPPTHTPTHPLVHTPGSTHDDQGDRPAAISDVPCLRDLIKVSLPN